MIAQQQLSIEAQAVQIGHMQRILSSLVLDVNMSTSAPIHLGSTLTSFGTMPPPPPLPPCFAHPPPTHQENDSEETEDEDLGF
ncbi:hypothetical protein TorRG33x02_353640 [Trema orientale]|uniref:Uncharacterized protein n=1 Tax=Trema orientale TaxID=63057 RepID=A0A2P5ACL8_TREOI|nr:hypothetical protein TorRG33x02_353640 [Trema orientale]